MIFLDSRSSAKYRQVRGVLLCGEDAQFLAHQGRERNRSEPTLEAPQPPPVGFASDDNEASARGQGSTKPGKQVVAADVENGVVALLARLDEAGPERSSGFGGRTRGTKACHLAPSSLGATALIHSGQP